MWNEERLSQGKKNTAMDKKFFNLSEDYLYAELSASLGVPQEKKPWRSAAPCKIRFA
ncbi:hypothetical protein HMPREF1548_01024 [Clostridium sp. KLE 1755]|jgi:CarD family transcriptional regulator|nr:hypothetical protein HMPREF1548_01024 [Clostridium sp. KLE 1755]